MRVYVASTQPLLSTVWGESIQGTAPESPRSSTDWSMGSMDTRKSRWSNKSPSVPEYSEPGGKDVQMYPVHRKKRGRPKKDRQPLGYRYKEPVPHVPIAHSTRSRSTRGSTTYSTPAVSEMGSVPGSTPAISSKDNLEMGMDAHNYAPLKSWSVSSKELMPPPRVPTKEIRVQAKS